MTTGFKIEVPGDYFARTAAREYADDAGLAVVREFAQNACDAGCTSFALSFSVDGTVVAQDDGKGCDAKTLREKVLTPLQSQKDDGAVGGFGKAKELLYFANESWSIRTRDVQVRGSYLEVLEFSTGHEYVQGFVAVVKFPTKLAEKALANARDFFRASERPGVTWLLHGEPVEPVVVRPRRCTKDFGFAKAYVTRDQADTYLYLRTNGLLTGKRYCYHGREVGRIVLELQGASTELLTPARDNFKHFPHREAVEGWLNALVTDYRRELADDEGDEILFFDNGEVEQVEDSEEAAPAATKPVVPSIPTSAVLPSVGGINAQVSFLSVVTVPSGEVSGEATTIVPESRKGFDLSLLPHIPGVGKVTVHTGSKKQGKVGAKWLAKNQAAARKLLAAWTTSVRGCSKASGLPVDAVGFTFVDNTLAEFVRTGGRWAVLVNPLLFDLNATTKVEEVLDLTTHELAHEATRGGHTEEWAAVEHSIRRQCRAPELRGAVARAFRTGDVESVE